MKLLGVLFALFVVGCGCEEVETGFVGVKTDWGSVKPGSLPEGFYTTGIGEEIILVNTRLLSVETAADASSKDLQRVSTKVAIQFSLDASMADKYVQKLGAGNIVPVVLTPATQEAVKATTSQYTAEQLITQRTAVKDGIVAALTKFIGDTLLSKDLAGFVKISNVAITDFDFSDGFNASIELKVQAEQEALKAVNEKTKKITDAEAAAATRKLESESTAYAIETASKARAEAIKREAEALRGNPELVKLRIAEKWDGKLPTYSGDTVPLLELK